MAAFAQIVHEFHHALIRRAQGGGDMIANLAGNGQAAIGARDVGAVGIVDKEIDELGGVWRPTVAVTLNLASPFLPFLVVIKITPFEARVP